MNTHPHPDLNTTLPETHGTTPPELLPATPGPTTPLPQESPIANLRKLLPTPSTPAKKKKCSATTASGAPCKAWARAAHHLCIFHDPGYRQQLRESAARGGAMCRPSLAELALAQRLHITDRAGLLEATAAIAGLLLNGAINPTRATNIVRLLSIADRTINPRQ